MIADHNCPVNQMEHSAGQIDIPNGRHCDSLNRTTDIRGPRVKTELKPTEPSQHEAQVRFNRISASRPQTGLSRPSSSPDTYAMGLPLILIRDNHIVPVKTSEIIIPVGYAAKRMTLKRHLNQ